MRWHLVLLCTLVVAGCGVAGPPERPVTQRNMEVGSSGGVRVHTSVGVQDGNAGVQIGF